MKSSSRISKVLITIGQVALLMQVLYLCAYVGWLCVDDRRYSVPNPQEDLHQFAERVFSPLQNLTNHMLGNHDLAPEPRTLEARIGQTE